MASHYYIIFSDLKGFSQLLEDEVLVFQEQVVPLLSAEIIDNQSSAKIWNTWGDAIFAAFEDGRDAVSFVLNYRKFFSNFDFSKVNLNRLLPRIAGHFGLAQVVDDPILGSVNLFGSNINTTARLEPVTRAGEIFVTSEFMDAYQKIPSTKEEIKFNQLGVIRLAKNFGEREVFRLCQQSEKDQIIDRIISHDLISYLPNAKEMTKSERKRIEYYKQSPDSETLLKNANIIDKNTHNQLFLFEVAKLLKDFGLYEEVIEFLDYLIDSYLVVDEINVYPMRHRLEFLKLRANALTRLGRYEEAADIVYGLWQAGHHDSDTLSMLAAQYKRRSIYSNRNKISKKTINYELLNRSLNLYLEAFRIDIDNYYPAINAAYVYIMISGKEEGRGIKLAQYIIDSWGEECGNDWWQMATIAEAQLLLKDYAVAENLFNRAIEACNPDRFMLAATREQISIYSEIKECQKDMKTILDILK